MYVILWEGTCNQALILAEGYCYLRGTGIFINHFSAFISMGRCKKLGSQNLHKILNYMRASSVDFPRAQSALSWPSPWIPVGRYCRSVTTLANNLILVKLDGGQLSVFYNPFPLGVKFDQGLGDISWPVGPTVLGMLLLKAGEDFLDRPLDVLLVDQAPSTVAKSLWTICLTSLLWSRTWLTLFFFPYLELHYYNHCSYRTVYLNNHFRLPHHH